MKFLTLLGIILFLSFSVQAQERTVRKLRGGIGANVSLPAGIFTTVYSLNIGGNLEAELPLSDAFAVSASAGYSQFLRKGGGEGIAFVPLLAGGSFQFTKDVFLAAHAGIAIPTFKSGGIVFNAEPAIGVRINDHWRLMANYNAYAQYGYIIGSAGIEAVFMF